MSPLETSNDHSQAFILTRDLDVEHFAAVQGLMSEYSLRDLKGNLPDSFKTRLLGILDSYGKPRSQKLKY